MKDKKYIFLTLLAISVTVVFLLLSRSSAIKESTWEDVEAEAELGGYLLINSEELLDIYDNNFNELKLIDTRQAWEYNIGFIAGAVNFPMEPTWWARWRKKGALENVLGPDRNHKLVFY